VAGTKTFDALVLGYVVRAWSTALLSNEVVDELNHALSNLFVSTGKVLARRWHVIPFHESSTPHEIRAAEDDHQRIHRGQPRQRAGVDGLMSRVNEKRARSATGVS
jgi:hypothetical protein